MQLSKQEIQTIKTYFTDKPVLKAYLFGSYSRGEADQDSDLDILVELDYSQHIGLGFFSLQSDLSEQLNKKVDLVPTESVPFYISPFINKDKQLIYEK
jgi:predicted nucleotidyltransferase